MMHWFSRLSGGTAVAMALASCSEVHSPPPTVATGRLTLVETLPWRARFTVSVTNPGDTEVCVQTPEADGLPLQYYDDASGEQYVSRNQHDFPSGKTHVLAAGEVQELTGMSPDIREWLLRDADGTLRDYAPGDALHVVAVFFPYPCSYHNANEAGHDGVAVMGTVSGPSDAFSVPGEE